MLKKIPLILLILLIRSSLSAQTTIDLTSLDEFRAQAGNWMIVGHIEINPEIDIHQNPAPKELPVEKKRKKKKRKKDKTPPAPPPPKAVTYLEGSGILLNLNDDQKRDALITTWEHGDIELEMEIMFPKGSNSGVYLQGRYEVQIFDSWGKTKPAFGDMGGIYKNRQKDPVKKWRGKAPGTNASKAPGLWQHLKLLFQAPKFDKQGNKIATARFVYVDLNGIRIHDDVEVTHFTGGALENNEVAMGPLFIQGDHGPVAFRNIRYKKFDPTEVELTDLSYKVYKGKFATIDDFKNTKPVATGKAQQINVFLAGEEDQYAIQFDGTIEVPNDENYKFTIAKSGGAVVVIDGKEQYSNQQAAAKNISAFDLELSAGKHSLTVFNYKKAAWRAPALGLYVNSNAGYKKALHDYESYPETADVPRAILVDAENQPRILRAFIDFKKDKSRRLSHTVGVGDPSELNYVYDLETGHPVAFWRGNFVDATPMWHNRGDGSFRPRGATVYTFTGTAMAYLESTNQAFPAIEETSYQSKGYKINPKTDCPIFIQKYGDLTVEHQLSTSEEKTHFVHRIKTENIDPTKSLYYKLGEGKAIQQLANGYFAIDDNSYYLAVRSNHRPIIRTIDGKEELIVKMSNEALDYHIIW